ISVVLIVIVTIFLRTLYNSSDGNRDFHYIFSTIVERIRIVAYLFTFLVERDFRNGITGIIILDGYRSIIIIPYPGNHPIFRIIGILFRINMLSTAGV